MDMDNEDMGVEEHESRGNGQGGDGKTLTAMTLIMRVLAPSENGED